MRRRTFLKGAAAGVGLAAAGSTTMARGAVNLVLPSLGVATNAPRPKTPVEHLVVLMMENRSVDHYLGWYAREHDEFDGVQHATYPDLRTPDDAADTVTTADWGARGRDNFHGRGHPDPSHGWGGGRAERNGGACDGWLHPDTGNDEYALSFYGPDDIPVWSQLVRGYQAYDRWFCSVLGPTYPNRYYLHSAQSHGMKNNDFPPQRAEENPVWLTGWDWPTIWTLMSNAGMTSAYYFSNLPVLGLWGARHAQHGRHISSFYADAAAGTLPQVSFLDPWFVEPQGLANDDHPHADIRLGQAFLSGVVEAFLTSPLYEKSALVITYDEWGGFWDHVDPPRVADDRATPGDPGGDDDFGQLGFRIPSTIVSPWTAARPGNKAKVDHNVYEHASVLRFISENWGLPYLTTRHATTTSIGAAFRDFRDYRAEPPAFEPYPLDPALIVEPTLERVAGSDLHALASTGWFDGLPFATDLRFEDSFLHRPATVRR